MPLKRPVLLANAVAWDVAAALLVGGAGGAAAAAALLLRRRPASFGKLTTAWSLAELAEPVVVARDVGELAVPPQARVVASGLVHPDVVQAAQVRQVPTVAAEYAVDARQPKAILFLAGLATGTRAIVVTDDAVVARLREEAQAAWSRASPYLERLPVALLAGRAGAVVETRGRVQDAMPADAGWLLRLEDGGAVVAVRVGRDPEPLRGLDVQVRGRLRKGADGYLVLEAEDLRRLV